MLIFKMILKGMKFKFNVRLIDIFMVMLVIFFYDVNFDNKFYRVL